jgi:hypothetical protein
VSKLEAFIFVWLIGIPFCLPGLFNRLGVFKSWYLARIIPGFSAGRLIVHMWPLSVAWLCLPFISLLPLDDETAMGVFAGTGIAGFLMVPVLAIWNPRWLKPAWQQRLENRYTLEEIEGFLLAWRKMDRQEWGRLIATDKGLEQLVELARNSQTLT